MRDQLQRFGRAAPQRMDDRAIAAAHVREQRADRRCAGEIAMSICPLCRRFTYELRLISAITLRAPRRLARSEDMMLFSSSLVSGAVDVHLGDVLRAQQLLVGDVAREHQRLVELGGEPLGAGLVVLDDLHAVALLDRAGEAPADVAAAADHDALHRLVHAPQLAHHAADVARSRR